MTKSVRLAALTLALVGLAAPALGAEESPPPPRPAFPT
jgi:hypothetical protein